MNIAVLRYDTACWSCACYRTQCTGPVHLRKTRKCRQNILNAQVSFFLSLVGLELKSHTFFYVGFLNCLFLKIPLLALRYCMPLLYGRIFYLRFLGQLKNTMHLFLCLSLTIGNELHFATC